MLSTRVTWQLWMPAEHMTGGCWRGRVETRGVAERQDHRIGSDSPDEKSAVSRSAATRDGALFGSTSLPPGVIERCRNGVPAINSTPAPGQARDRALHHALAMPCQNGLTSASASICRGPETHVVLVDARPSVASIAGSKLRPKIKAIATTIIPAKPIERSAGSGKRASRRDRRSP